MNSNQNQKKRLYITLPLKFPYALFSFIVIFGSALRVYWLDRQIIGDDEWHAIYYAANKSLKYIATHYHAADNCIPLTIYYKILLETIGLSEFWLHSLQIISGVSALIIFPFLIRKLFPQKVVLIFSFLLATSPFLIYYSRYARPYMIILFLSYISIFSFYHWINNRKNIYIVFNMLSAILAPYFHLFSFPFVIAPYIYMFIFSIKERKLTTNDKSVYPDLSHLIYIGIAVLSGIAIWLLPAVRSLKQLTQKVNDGFIDFYTVIGSVSLFSGSTNHVVSFLFVLFFIYGAFRIFRNNQFLFGYLSFVFISVLSAIIVSKPEAIQEPIVFSRYAVCCLPIWLLFVSIGIDGLFNNMAKLIENINIYLKVIYPLSWFVLPCFLLILFINGPILHIYASPNNFTNNNDFQASYMYSWGDEHEIHESLYPNFYNTLKNIEEKVRIIETPYMIFWIATNFDLYQQWHEKEVFIGYNKESFLAQKEPIMHNKIHLKNYINVDSYDAIIRSNVSYIVVHKKLLDEFIYVRSNLSDFKKWAIFLKLNENFYREYYGKPSEEQAQKTIESLQIRMGSPWYEDKFITVFKTHLPIR